MKNFLKLSLIAFITLFISCSSDDDYVPVAVEYPVPEFMAKLSELKLFEGDLANLEPTEHVNIYELNTSLFTDYAQKLRFLSIPEGAKMIYNGGGLPIYPDGTIMTKTFYYYNVDNNPSQGKQIIETRVLILKSGVWNIGNYVWNDEQTEAFLDDASYTKSITWTDSQGIETTFDYVIPSYTSCVDCHQNDGVRIPIGPMARNMNVTINGVNQLQEFIDNGILAEAPSVSDIVKLPVWDDLSFSLEERARAYLDVNCAHCHQPGGFFDLNFFSNFELRYETPFEEANIYSKRNVIISRINSDIEGYKMPFIGTSLFHAEGILLLEEYLESL
ncbi:MAG: hypothetical protein L3J09_00240 [Flavobacteriaceae bacterium]|nr:hypothetical protein [Flavobacteriaceae bacterium]